MQHQQKVSGGSILQAIIKLFQDSHMSAEQQSQQSILVLFPTRSLANSFDNISCVSWSSVQVF
jgi:hypothetical protein